jgi:hypothetical protein
MTARALRRALADRKHLGPAGGNLRERSTSGVLTVQTPMVKRIVGVASLFLVFSPMAQQLPPPKVNADSWVMIEIWPDPKAITLAAYFLDSTYEKSRDLCEVTKRVFERDQAARGREIGRANTSYRLCLSVADARSAGYIR